MNILLLRAGIFSYVNDYIHESLCRRHNVVGNVDAGKVIDRNTLQFTSWYNILYTMFHSRYYWKQTHSKNSYAFRQMTRYCNRHVRSRTDYDIIFQTQCKFSITKNPYTRPYFIYTDLTQKLTDRIWKGWTLKADTKEMTDWYRLEAQAFDRADRIFTFNDSVKASFIEDYHIDPNKVVPVGSGINDSNNSQITFEDKFKYGFLITFITTEFERQGGDFVVNAYRLIKPMIPEAKLVICGKCPKKLPEGVEIHKNLTQKFIDNLLDNTSIFLMPGVIGGLQSVLQAMNKKCACIVGSTNLLLNHVIKNNETGLIVTTGNIQELAEKISYLYREKSLLKKIANQAHCFVNENFTWDKVVNRMTQYF